MFHNQSTTKLCLFGHAHCSVSRTCGSVPLRAQKLVLQRCVHSTRVPGHTLASPSKEEVLAHIVGGDDGGRRREKGSSEAEEDEEDGHRVMATPCIRTHTKTRPKQVNQNTSF